MKPTIKICRKTFSLNLKILKKRELFDYAILPLKEVDVNTMAKWFKKASSIRPERYTLWNEIDSKKIDWKNIIEEVVGENYAG